MRFHLHRWQWCYLRRIHKAGYPVTQIRKRCRFCTKWKLTEVDGHVYWSDLL